MVVDAHLGGRRLVTDYPDFTHLEKADRVITALPGDGWRACDWGRGPRNPDSSVEPVLAWLVLSSGTVVPITMDAAMVAIMPGDVSAFRSRSIPRCNAPSIEVASSHQDLMRSIRA